MWQFGVSSSKQKFAVLNLRILLKCASEAVESLNFVYAHRYVILISVQFMKLIWASLSIAGHSGSSR